MVVPSWTDLLVGVEGTDVDAGMARSAQRSCLGGESYGLSPLWVDKPAAKNRASM